MAEKERPGDITEQVKGILNQIPSDPFADNSVMEIDEADTVNVQRLAFIARVIAEKIRGLNSKKTVPSDEPMGIHIQTRVVEGLGIGDVMLESTDGNRYVSWAAEHGVNTMHALTIGIHTDVDTEPQARDLFDSNPDASKHFKTTYYFGENGSAIKAVNVIEHMISESDPQIQRYATCTEARPLTKKDVVIANEAMGRLISIFMPRR